MSFYSDLQTLALMPSEFNHENLVREWLISRLEKCVDSIEIDEMGNLYVVREGSKKGSVMLSSHQDKVMDSTEIGQVYEGQSRLDTNLLFDDEGDAVRSLTDPLFVLTDKGYVSLPLSKIPRRQRGNDMGMFYTIPGLFADTSGLELGEDPASVYALHYSKRGGLVYGKMDDTVGLATIIEILTGTKRKDTSTIMGAFTVGEEVGLQGSSYAVKEGIVGRQYCPDKIMVIDTTALQEPGSGIVLYEDCAHESGFGFQTTTSEKEPLVAEIEEFARERRVNLTTHPAFINDSNEFALTGIPTVAIEIPVLNNHLAIEASSQRDINLARRFVKAYLTR